MSTETRATTRTLHVRVIGEIWQPGFVCAAEETVTDFDRLGIDPTNADDVRGWADTHLGDFSRITGIDAELVETRQGVPVIGEDGWVTTSTRTRRTQVLTFTDVEEDTWVRAMFGEED